MHSCTKIIEFEAAHRIAEYDGPCRNLHGHRYVAEVTFTSSTLDHLGMVLDFALIKARFLQWIKNNWDHTVILSNADSELGKQIASITQQPIFYLPGPPSAEFMANYLLLEVMPELFSDLPDVYCSKIRLHETSTSFAEATSTSLQDVQHQ